MEVSAVSHDDWMCNNSPLSVGRIVCQEIQQPEAIVEGPNTPTLVNPQSTKVYPDSFTSQGWDGWLLVLILLQTAVMPTEASDSSIDGLAILTAKLDSLNVDQDADDLSDVLRSAFTECELYNTYLSSVVEDEAKVKVLLEVFDKVWTEIKRHSVGSFSASPLGTGSYSPTK